MAALEEAITIITGVWGDEPFTFNGAHFSTSNERVFPPHRQRPGPPLIIAGGGERVTLRLVARYAQACNFGASDTTGGARTTADIARTFSALRDHRADLGRSYDAILRTLFTSWIFLAATGEEAHAKLKRSHPAPSRRCGGSLASPVISRKWRKSIRTLSTRASSTSSSKPKTPPI